MCPGRIREIGDYRQLKLPLGISRGVLLPKAALAQHRALSLQLGGEIPLREAAFELHPRLPPRGSGRHQRQTFDVMRKLDRVEQGE
jgi:hypothetical protein